MGKSEGQLLCLAKPGRSARPARILAGPKYSVREPGNYPLTNTLAQD